MVLGPKVVTRALGYTITKEELGGPSVHCDSGVVDNIVATEEDAFQQLKQRVSFHSRFSAARVYPRGVHFFPIQPRTLGRLLWFASHECIYFRLFGFVGVTTDFCRTFLKMWMSYHQ